MRGQFDLRLRQATGVAKAPHVADFVRMLLQTEDKVVLWGWHRAVYAIWLERLADYKPVLYTGTESPTQKAESHAAFVKGESRVLVMSLRSGQGINGLEEVCNDGVFGELDWSPEVHWQCLGRLRRGRQRKTVRGWYLLSEDGSDPFIADVLEVKRQQGEPIANPDRPLIRESTIDPAERMRLYAEAYLAQHETLAPIRARR